MKKYFGEYIRDQAIKNLLSAQARIAEIGSASEVISLTKFVLKISNKFDNVLLDFGLEHCDESAEQPPDEKGEWWRMDVKNLDSVSREKQKAILNNVIFRCMIENHMTLENLDEACEVIREIYRKNAILTSSLRE